MGAILVLRVSWPRGLGSVLRETPGMDSKRFRVLGVWGFRIQGVTGLGLWVFGVGGGLGV